LFTETFPLAQPQNVPNYYITQHVQNKVKQNTKHPQHIKAPVSSATIVVGHGVHNKLDVSKYSVVMQYGLRVSDKLLPIRQVINNTSNLQVKASVIFKALRVSSLRDKFWRHADLNLRIAVFYF
jgi:hypothetical protein